MGDVERPLLRTHHRHGQMSRKAAVRLLELQELVDVQDLLRVWIPAMLTLLKETSSGKDASSSQFWLSIHRVEGSSWLGLAGTMKMSMCQVTMSLADPECVAASS